MTLYSFFSYGEHFLLHIAATFLLISAAARLLKTDKRKPFLGLMI